jgi:hypothetical protein
LLPARASRARAGARGEPQALLEVRAGGGEVALLGGEHARAVGRAHPQLRRPPLEGQRAASARPSATLPRITQ